MYFFFFFGQRTSSGVRGFALAGSRHYDLRAATNDGESSPPLQAPPARHSSSYGLLFPCYRHFSPNALPFTPPAAAAAHSSDFYFTFSISRSERNGSRSSRTEQNRFRVCYSPRNCAPKPTYYSRFGCTLVGLFLLRPPITITTAMECKLAGLTNRTLRRVHCETLPETKTVTKTHTHTELIRLVRYRKDCRTKKKLSQAQSSVRSFSAHSYRRRCSVPAQHPRGRFSTRGLTFASGRQ